MAVEEEVEVEAASLSGRYCTDRPLNTARLIRRWRCRFFNMCNWKLLRPSWLAPRLF